MIIVAIGAVELSMTDVTGLIGHRMVSRTASLFGCEEVRANLYVRMNDTIYYHTGDDRGRFGCIPDDSRRRNKCNKRTSNKLYKLCRFGSEVIYS